MYLFEIKFINSHQLRKGKGNEISKSNFSCLICLKIVCQQAGVPKNQTAGTHNVIFQRLEINITETAKSK